MGDVSLPSGVRNARIRRLHHVYYRVPFQKMVHSIPLYFRVMAKNSMGSTSTISCELPTYDMTLPEGRITASFGSTSYPEALRGSTLALDDSVLAVQMVGCRFF